MASNKTIKAAALGASGYTGADMVRLAARHPHIEIKALIAKGHAGQPLAQVFPHLASLDLPALVTSDQVDWSKIDVVFGALPHGTAHSEIVKLPDDVKVVDMSADFRLRDPKDLMQVSIQDSMSAVVSPAAALSTDSPASRIRLERLGKSSVVLARCTAADQGTPVDQSKYEPLFRTASSVMATYRKALRVRSTIPDEIARVAAVSRSSGQHRPPAKRP